MGLLIELLVELFLTLFGEGLAQWAGDQIGARLSGVRVRLVALIGYALGGLAFGALTWLVYPLPVLGSPEARVANVIVTPVLVALVVRRAAARLRAPRVLMRPAERFALAWVFAVAVAVVRLVLAW